MFKIKWAPKCNGVILSEYIEEDEMLHNPRPVYVEELTMLGLDKQFQLPKKNVPVCWEIDRKYYYCGELIAETRGGNIYKDPEVIVYGSYQGRTLHAIDIETVVKLNEKPLSDAENEAMDFIKEKYEEFQSRQGNRDEDITGFVVAFSGGKDSQVILDLVSRVIPHEKFTTIFTNTGMELPCTVDFVEATREFYRQKFSGFELKQASSDRTALEMWKRYGPPSRVNRWCCSVLKTALFGRKMKEILKVSSQPHLVVFEGVRRDESAKRSSYNRVGDGVKHIKLINCRPILKWNATETYLYLYKNHVQLNPAYTIGLTRVGCGICPFASDWSEYVIRKRYPQITEDYVSVIEEMAANMGIAPKAKIDEYIALGNWKKNAGGKGVTQDSSRIDIISKAPNFECIVQSPKMNWETWFSTIGEYFVEKISENHYSGELQFNGKVVKFEIIYGEKSLRFKAFGTTNQIMLTSYLTKAFTKTAYCESCGVCEIECPSGALTVGKTVEIAQSKCVRCHNCFEINTKGCIIATRRTIYEGGKAVGGTATKTSGIDKYSTFGMRDEWVAVFFEALDDWFDGYADLGPKQIPAMLNWLREAELVDKNEKKVTELTRMLKPVYRTNPLIVWQIIWINLAFNSAIANWYVNTVNQEASYTKQELVELLKERYPNLKGATLKNPVDALVNTFCCSPLGSTDPQDSGSLCVGLLEKQGNQVKQVRKYGTSKISSAAVAYLLYKNAQENNMYELTVSDIYEKGCMGVKNIFSMDSVSFLNALRGLTNYEVLSADLLGGLENIHLEKEFSPLAVLNKMLKKI